MASPVVQPSEQHRSNATRRQRFWTWFRPPVLSVGLLGLALLAFTLLGLRPGSLDGQAWTSWRLTGALGICAAIVLFVQGWKLLRNRRTGEGTAVALRMVRRRALAGYLLFALLFVAGVIGLLIAERDSGGPEFDDATHMVVRTRTVLLTCAIAVTPWLMLVWLTHSDSRRLRNPPILLAPLLHLRAQMNSCVLAFASFVVIALVPTGALRAFWLTTDRKGSFTTTDVLLYGAFFAAALAAVTLPLLGSWRRTATLLVDETHPAADATAVTKTWKEERDSLEEVLGLNRGLLQSPLAALTFLTPLVTSVLAAFVPEIA